MTPRSGGRGHEVNSCKADEVFGEHGGGLAGFSLYPLSRRWSRKDGRLVEALFSSPVGREV